MEGQQQQDAATDVEVIEPEGGKHAKSARQIARYTAPPSEIAPWAPSALALLSDEEFESRLVMAKRERDRIAQIQKAVMTEDVDYGVIPGTNKPTLYKPGAEILNRMAGLSPAFRVTREVGDDVTAPAIRFQVQCQLLRGDVVIAEGDGSANSWERKHRYRKAELVCPNCGRNQIRRGDTEFFCWRRKGGCGETFALDNPQLIGQSDEIVNPDPHDLDNTLLKMAEKRAMVAVTLIAHAASGIFSQDIEDDDDATAAGDRKPKQQQQRGNGGGNGRNGARPPAQAANPDERLNQGQKNLAIARAKKRAADLGLDGDAHVTLLNDVLAGGDVKSLDEVRVARLDDMLAAIDAYEIPANA